MTDLSRELAMADRRLALTAPQQHPAPAHHQREQRQRLMAARKAKPKEMNLAKKLKIMQRLHKPQAPAEPAPPPPTPEERRSHEVVRQEVQSDLCTALVKGTQALAGRWCSPEAAQKIEQSPAVQELLARTTGWVHSAPDIMKLPLVIGAKLL